MIRRTVFLIGLFVLLLPAAAALAGGWVVITLDDLPEQIRTGEPTELTFMIRQHGKTPTHDVEPVLTATNAETGERIQIKAEPAKEIGRFMVAIDFPSAGLWQWSISAEPFPQTMAFAPLTVLPAEKVAGMKQVQQAAPAAQAAGPVEADLAGLAWQTPARWLGLAFLVAAGALFLVSRRRERAVVAPASGD